jgi:uncharacterized membrane protein YhaH (DUF805 family)
MNFIASVKTCYQKYFVLAGRASRREYWFFRLYVVLCSLLISILSGLFPQFVAELPPVAFPIASIFMFALPDIAVQVRRFHDRGLSGYWLLPTYVVIPVIAVVAVYFMSQYPREYAYSQRDAFIGLGALWLGASIAILVVSALPSLEGENRYGVCPIETAPSHTGSTKKTNDVLIGTQHNTNKQTNLVHLFKNEGEVAMSDISNSKITSVEQSTNSLELTDAAKILLKYRSDVKALHDELCAYAFSLNVLFTNKMAVDPTQNPDEIFRSIVLQHLGRPDMEWSNDIWNAAKTVASNGTKAIQEFTEVFPLLSATMSPTEIMVKVIAATRGETVRSYAFPGKDGTMHKVNIYSNGSFAIEGYLESFQRAEDVYNALGTPNNKRNPYYMLKPWSKNE